jgi:metal-sulfur cluster biosynthetic enzyme
VSDTIEVAVAEALGRVHDPCSLASGVPLSVQDMGLVRGWELSDDGILQVTICVTWHGCTMVGNIIRGIEESAGAIDGVRSVQVSVLEDDVWAPELISERGQAALARQRRLRTQLTGLRPREWKESRHGPRSRARPV